MYSLRDTDSSIGAVHGPDRTHSERAPRRRICVVPDTPSLPVALRQNGCPLAASLHLTGQQSDRRLAQPDILSQHYAFPRVPSQV